MKANHFIILSLLIITISCAGKNNGKNIADENIDSTLIVKLVPDSFSNGKVITHVYCKADAEQSYALYIPVKSNNEPMPVIYFFDPQGDGSLPLDKYKLLANRYNFIFIGSNNSRNGNDIATGENVWNTMFADSRNRLNINTNRVYVCGFSGGAKVATSIALNHNEIKGVIANGAGSSEITDAGNFNFSFTAIAGEGDLNMTDLVAITNSLDDSKTRHRIIFFDGIHEWAPENTMNDALAALQLDAMQQNLIPSNPAFINNYIVESKKRISDFLQENNYLKAEIECRFSASVLSGVTNDVAWFTKKHSDIISNSSYQKQAQARQQLLLKEQKIKQDYELQFQNGDTNYWAKTIAYVKTKAKGKTPEGGMYKRLQAYLSLAFYSISNQLIKSNQNNEAAYFVNLYKMVDPINAEAWYFSAILDARDNNSRATKEDLLKAVANGFNDKSRLMQQNEFRSLATQINLIEIERSMK